MSQPAPSPPPAVPQGGPPHSRKRCCQGCAPILVFLLAVICAGSLVALRCGCTVRTEDAGRVVMEFLEQNSKEEMKAHRRNAMSHKVLENVLKRLNLVVEKGLNLARNPQASYDVRDRLLKNLQVDVDGRFLTITVYEKEQSPAGLANAVAAELDEDIKTVQEEHWRTFSQNREARIKTHMETAEKARLEWLDMMKKYNLEPANSAIAETQEAEMRARLVKAQADLLMQEARMGLTKDTDADLAVAKAAVQTYQKQVQAGAAEATARLMRQSEYVAAKAAYDTQLATLQKLREDDIASRITQGVVQRPTRVVDEAHPIQAPDRKFRRKLQAAAVISGVLLAASLLASVTRFLRRL